MVRAVYTAVLLFAVSAAVYASEQGEDSVKGIVCEGLYALCTSAPCIPDPTDPEKKAVCSCEVADGKSFGMKTCPERKASTDANGVTKVTSTFSFAQAPTKPVLVCPSGKPWTDCLDSPCIVDPRDPLHAVCTCGIERSGAFVTLGGDCNTITCDTGYWSGATPDTNQAVSEQLMKEFGIDTSPMTLCPGMEPK